MTRGQEAFPISFSESSEGSILEDVNQDGLIVTNPNSNELEAHNNFISKITIKN